MLVRMNITLVFLTALAILALGCGEVQPLNFGLPYSEEDGGDSSETENDAGLDGAGKDAGNQADATTSEDASTESNNSQQACYKTISDLKKEKEVKILTEAPIKFEDRADYANKTFDVPKSNVAHLHRFQAYANEHLKIYVNSKLVHYPILAVYDFENNLAICDANQDEDETASVILIPKDGIYTAAVSFNIKENDSDNSTEGGIYYITISSSNSDDYNEGTQPPNQLCKTSEECPEDQICTNERSNSPECLQPPECSDPAECDYVCYGRCVSGSKESIACHCGGEEYDPICGADFVTYSNECQLKCANQEKLYDGHCSTDQEWCKKRHCLPGEEIVGCSDETDREGCPLECVCAPVGADRCEKDLNCKAGEVCELTCFRGKDYCIGVCKSEEAWFRTCLNNDQCEEDENCVQPVELAGLCLPPPDCESNDADCAQQCAGVCLSPQKDRVCYASTDCLGGEVCSVELGECLPPPGCDASQQCPDVCSGRCIGDPECGCPSFYAPACGEDDVTYGNRCLSHCYGASETKEGKCE